MSRVIFWVNSSHPYGRLKILSEEIITECGVDYFRPHSSWELSSLKRELVGWYLVKYVRVRIEPGLPTHVSSHDIFTKSIQDAFTLCSGWRTPEDTNGVTWVYGVSSVDLIT